MSFSKKMCQFKCCRLRDFLLRILNVKLFPYNNDIFSSFIRRNENKFQVFSRLTKSILKYGLVFKDNLRVWTLCPLFITPLRKGQTLDLSVKTFKNQYETKYIFFVFIGLYNHLFFC